MHTGKRIRAESCRGVLTEDLFWGGNDRLVQTRRPVRCARKNYRTEEFKLRPSRRDGLGNSSRFEDPSPVEPLKHEHLPAGVDERAAEEEAVHRLVHQPVEHHLPVPRADGHPQLEVAALAQVVVADGKQVHHLHVKGDSGAHGDGGQLVGHLLTIDKHGTWTWTHKPGL